MIQSLMLASMAAADAAKISSAAVVLNIILNLAGLWKAYPVLTGDFMRCLLPMIGAALL